MMPINHSAGQPSQQKITVMHMYQNSNVGGVQQQLLSILLAYDRNLVTPVFCCFSPKGEIALEMEKHGIDVVSLNRSRYSRFSPGIILALRRLIKERRPDVVRTHRYRANFYGRIAAWLAGTRVIISSVHDNYRNDKRPGRRLINIILARITDKVVAVSDSIKDDIAQYDFVPPSKLSVIRNGIDLERFSCPEDHSSVRNEFGLRSSDIVIGSVGRLVPAKGLGYLLEAVSLLKADLPAIRLLIVGSGGLHQGLSDKAHELGISDRVIFTGQRRDIPSILYAVDIFAMPSIAEGLPNSLLEAMACGKPVVAATVGGIPDVIQHGITGLLVQPRDASALASALSDLITDRKRAAAIGLQARQFIKEHYSIQTTCRAWVSLYKQILTEKGLI